jgi:hypothetical protein
VGTGSITDGYDIHRGVADCSGLAGYNTEPTVVSDPRSISKLVITEAIFDTSDDCCLLFFWHCG